MNKTFLLWLCCAGCGSSSAPVTLAFSKGATAMPSPGSGYTAATGTVGTNMDGQLVLDSQVGGAELKIAVDTPQLPMTIQVGGGIHLTVEYSRTPGGPTWVSNGGFVTFLTVASPYSVTFDQLQMIGSSATGAQGGFTIDGTGSFAK